VELITTYDNFSFKEDKISYFQKYIDEENSLEPWYKLGWVKTKIRLLKGDFFVV
jgi:hypothetical protein